MNMLSCRLVLVTLLAAFALSIQTRAQTSESAGQQEFVVTISAQGIGVDPGVDGKNIGGRLLFNRARYHAGDDPAWADPAFDDQRWEIVDPALPPGSRPRQGWPGIGWFRFRLRVDASLRDHALGFVIDHSGAVEAYLDGRLVYQSGTVGASRAEEDPHVDQDPFVLPLEAGHEHVLALRYSSFVTEGFRARWYQTGVALYWGERATMTRHRGFVRFNQGVFSAFYLGFALLFGLLYGLYRSERLFLYLAMLYGLLVPFVFIMHQFPFVHAPELVMPLVDAHCAFLASALLAMLIVLYALFYPARPRQFYGFLLVGLAATMAVFVRLENVTYFFVFLFLGNIEILRVVVVALWRRKRWAWIMGVGLAPIIIIQLWGQFEALGWLTTPWSGSPFDPIMIGMVFFSCAFAVYVGVRFAEASRGLAELEAARRLQLSMLPERVPEHPRVELAASMQTASEVGGDYYDFDLSDDGTLTIAIGDATGHGTKAGIMVTATKSLWNAFCSDADLEQVLHKSSVALKRMLLPKLYMALALARLRGHTLELVGAGLPPALVYRADTGEVEAVPLKGMPLGSPGRAQYRKQCVVLSPGDTVVLMTDGFPERFSNNGEMLGYDRAVSVFAEVADRSSEEIIGHLMNRCETWANGRAQDDDVTFVVMKMKASTEGKEADTV
jgi:hypothetical protein